MKYSGIIKNDVSAGKGVCVSFFTQGCPHHCPDCHNPETWSFDGGKDFTHKVLNEIIDAISANGILRNFCIMGGEPLCPDNLFLTNLVCSAVREQYPTIDIYIWTGYKYEEIKNDKRIIEIFNQSNYLIDGKYDKTLRDITLSMRGSSNQRIINLQTNEVLK